MPRSKIGFDNPTVIEHLVRGPLGDFLALPKRDRAIGQAAETYTLLAIGDGLVAQIPSLIISIAAGMVVSRVANEDDAPDALQSEYRMREVVLAAALQGAIFAATKAAIDRAGARGFTKLTGSWPGD